MQNNFLRIFVFCKRQNKPIFLIKLEPKNNYIKSASVLAKILRNKCGSKCETRIHENDSKILKVWNHCTNAIKYFEYF